MILKNRKTKRKKDKTERTEYKQLKVGEHDVREGPEQSQFERYVLHHQMKLATAVEGKEPQLVPERVLALSLSLSDFSG